MNISPVNFTGCPPKPYKLNYSNGITGGAFNKYANYEQFTKKSVNTYIEYFQNMLKENPNSDIARIMLKTYQDILSDLERGIKPKV